MKCRLDEAQAGIKITGRNIKTSNMQMTPPLWQIEELLKTLLMKVKEESEKIGLSLCSIQDTGCLGLVHGDDPER